MTVEVNLRAAAFGEDSSERNCVFTKGVLVFSAIDIAGDFSLIATFGEDLGVLADFGLGLRSSSQEMLEVQLDEAIRGTGFEETALVFG